MWNINLKRGTVWTTKSINQYEICYDGMTCGSIKVLLLSVYTDVTGNEIYTYLKVFDREKANRQCTPITLNNKTVYVELHELLTGDQRSLEAFVGNVSIPDVNRVVEEAKTHFNLYKEKEKKVKPVEKIDYKSCQQKIFKFGIDIYVTESDDVKISKSKKLTLSQRCKNDIIYNSKTDEDIRILCDKYSIYPVKAIREIKNRLVYQHKQKEG